MPDREKVIKGLEKMLSNFDALDEIAINKKNQMLLMHMAIAKEVLALLKEQEAVKPTWVRGKPFCGACGLRIRSGGKFCSECGRPVLWEGR